MQSNIMVTVGPSPISGEIIKFADKEAQKSNCELIVLHVVERTPYYPNSKADFEGFISKIEIQSPHHIITPFGYPSTEIIKQVNQYKPLQIIMGGHSHNILERVFLGSTVKYVLHHSDLPVFIYKKPWVDRPANIIVPVDYSEVNNKVISIAEKWAEDCDSVIHFIHVIPPLGVYADWGTEAYGPITPQHEEDLEAEKVKSHKKLEGFVEGLNIKSKYKTHVKVGVVYQEVVDLQRITKSSLILLASHSHNIIGRLLVGGNTDAIINHAGCSVFVYQSAISVD